MKYSLTSPPGLTFVLEEQTTSGFFTPVYEGTEIFAIQLISYVVGTNASRAFTLIKGVEEPAYYTTQPIKLARGINDSRAF